MFSTEFIDTFTDLLAVKLSANINHEKGVVQQRLMGVPDGARYLGKTKQAIYHLVNQERIPYKRIGSRLYFDRLELDRWIDDQTN